MSVDVMTVITDAPNHLKKINHHIIFKKLIKKTRIFFKI